MRPALAADSTLLPCFVLLNSPTSSSKQPALFQQCLAVLAKWRRHPTYNTPLTLFKRCLLLLPTATWCRSLLRSALWLGPRYRVIFVAPNGSQLASIAQLYTEGKLKPTLAAVLPLEKAA